MTIALLFGGQGTEMPGMGLALARDHAPADSLLCLAGKLAGIDAHHALANGSPALSRTAVIQPLLAAVGLGAWSALEDAGLAPSHVAGHSLGEVAGWAVARTFGAREAIELAAARGRLMEREAALHPGGMLAITGTEESVLEHVRAVQGPEVETSTRSIVVAAHNAPTEWTLSGDARSLAAVAARTRTTRLQVAGAWHSPAMAGAIDEVLESVRMGLRSPDPRASASPNRPTVVTNRTGQLAKPDDDVASLLAEQLVRPVQWAKTLATLAAAGVDHFVVAGPGKLMRALVQKNLGTRTRVSIVETLADVQTLASELRL